MATSLTFLHRLGTLALVLLAALAAVNTETVLVEPKNVAEFKQQHQLSRGGKVARFRSCNTFPGVVYDETRQAWCTQNRATPVCREDQIEAAHIRDEILIRNTPVGERDTDEFKKKLIFEKGREEYNVQNAHIKTLEQSIREKEPIVCPATRGFPSPLTIPFRASEGVYAIPYQEANDLFGLTHRNALTTRIRTSHALKAGALQALGADFTTAPEFGSPYLATRAGLIFVYLVGGAPVSVMHFGDSTFISTEPKTMANFLQAAKDVLPQQELRETVEKLLFKIMRVVLTPEENLNRGDSPAVTPIVTPVPPITPVTPNPAGAGAAAAPNAANPITPDTPASHDKCPLAQGWSTWLESKPTKSMKERLPFHCKEWVKKTYSNEVATLQNTLDNVLYWWAENNPAVRKKVTMNAVRKWRRGAPTGGKARTSKQSRRVAYQIWDLVDAAAEKMMGPDGKLVVNKDVLLNDLARAVRKNTDVIYVEFQNKTGLAGLIEAKSKAEARGLMRAGCTSQGQLKALREEQAHLKHLLLRYTNTDSAMRKRRQEQTKTVYKEVTQSLQATGDGGQPLACAVGEHGLRLIVDEYMRVLEDGNGFGVSPVYDESMVVVHWPSENDLPREPFTPKELAVKALPGDSTTAAELAAALGWDPSYIRTFSWRTTEGGGWRVRLSKEGKALNKHVEGSEVAPALLVKDLVFPKFDFKPDGTSGYPFVKEKREILVSDLPATLEADSRGRLNGADVMEQLSTGGLVVGGDDDDDDDPVDLASLGVKLGTATRRDDGNVVIQLVAVDDDAVFESENFIEKVLQAHRRFHAVYTFTMTKGWDAFPWLKRTGFFGETLASAMIHFHVKGAEGSVFNTHVLCLIKGDDGEEEYRACDAACGLRDQYDSVCLNPKRYKVMRGMFKGDDTTSVLRDAVVIKGEVVAAKAEDEKAANLTFAEAERVAAESGADNNDLWLLKQEALDKWESAQDGLKVATEELASTKRTAIDLQSGLEATSKAKCDAAVGPAQQAQSTAAELKAFEDVDLKAAGEKKKSAEKALQHALDARDEEQTAVNDALLETAKDEEGAAQSTHSYLKDMAEEANERSERSSVECVNADEAAAAHGYAWVYAKFCGPTVPDSKAGFTLAGQRTFKPYLCNVCTEDWKTAVRHEPHTCSIIDRGADDHLMRSYYAGVVNVLGKKKFNRNLHLETYVHQAHKIPRMLEHIEKVDDGEELGGLQELRVQGEKLLDICNAISSDVTGGQKVISALKGQCTSLAHELNPEALVGVQGKPRRVLHMLSETDLSTAYQKTASPNDDFSNAKKISALVKTLATPTPPQGLEAFIREKTRHPTAPTTNRIPKVKMAHDDMKKAKYFNDQLELHSGGLRAVAQRTVSYYKATLLGLNLATGQLSTGFGDHLFPADFPPELQDIVTDIFREAEELETIIASDDDDELHRVALAGVKAVLKSTKTNPQAKLDVPEGLNGILYPHMFEWTGEYYPGILHQGWLRTIGFLINTILELGRQYDILKALKPSSSYYTEHQLGSREFKHTEHVSGSILSTMRQWLEKPDCGLVVKVKEDDYKKIMRLKRPDAARLAVALTKPFHELFGDTETAFLVEHLMSLFQFSIDVLNMRMDVPEVYDIPGPQLVKELRKAHVQLRELLHVLVPPTNSKREGEWTSWENTYSVHIYLLHMLDIFEARGFVYGDINEFCYEMKHCNTKRVALKHTGAGGLRLVVEQMLVDELSLVGEETGRKSIVEKISHNHKKVHDDRYIREKRRHRRRALLSMDVVGGCIQAAGILDAEHVCAAPGVCTIAHDHSSDRCDDDKIKHMFQNMYKSPDEHTDFNNHPTFPDYPRYVSPAHIGKLIKWDKRNTKKGLAAIPAGDDDEDGGPDEDGEEDGGDDDDDTYDAEEGGRVNDARGCDADDAPGSQGAPCQATNLENGMAQEEEDDWADREGQQLEEQLRSEENYDEDDDDGGDDQRDPREEQEERARTSGASLTQTLTLSVSGSSSSSSSSSSSASSGSTRTRRVRPPNRPAIEGWDHGRCHGGNCDVELDFD